jgi:hypothetical protein
MQIKLTLVTFSLVLLAACGGGGSSSGTTPPTLIEGRVIDGYIRGATVCLDLNNNLVCDAGEPSAQSGAGGVYSFAYSGPIEGLKIIANVPAGAFDEDLGTLAQGFDLLTPASQPQVVSPLTTLVSIEMINRRIPAAEAEQAVMVNFNFQAPSLLGYDFKAAADDSTLQVAQVVAASLAVAKEFFEQQADLKQLSLRDQLTSSVTEVKTNLLPALIAPSGQVVQGVLGQGTTQASLISSTRQISNANTVLADRTVSIVARSKAPTVELTLTVQDVLLEGLTLSVQHTGQYLVNEQDPPSAAVSYQNKLRTEFTQASQDGQINSRYQKVWVPSPSGGHWFTVFDDDDNDSYVSFVDGKWVNYTRAERDNIKFSIEGNCANLPFFSGTQQGQRFCSVARDLSGQPIADFVSGVTNSALRFPQGSFGFDMTQTVTTDFYEIEVNPNWSGAPYEGKDQNTAPSLGAFISYLKTRPTYKTNNCGLALMVDSYNEQTRQGTVKWGRNTQTQSDRCQSPQVSTYTEETSFRLVTLAGKDVMVVTRPALYRQVDPSNTFNNELVFAVVSNGEREGIFDGKFYRAALSSTVFFDGNISQGVQFANKTLFDAAIEALGYQPYPYPSSNKD